ncbi:MAG: DMT family transporter [Alphaproteobacteria bacterium]|nr:DMT family transporter [Alphaproteobacteria bacterium]
MTDSTSASPSIIPGLSDERLASILLFITPAFFAANILVARATADFIPPIHLAFLRWVATFLLLLPLVGPRLWVRRAAILREWKDLLILGALGMGICGAFVYIAADTTTAVNIGLIYAASPVLITLMSALIYKETVHPLGIVGMVLSLTGVLIIICRGDIQVMLSLAFTEGDLWIVASMISWALYSVLLRHRPSEMGLTTRLGAIVLSGIIVLAPFTLWETMQGDTPDWGWDVFGWVAILALFASFGAYQLHGFVQKTLGAGRTSLFLYLMPLYSAGLAWLLLGEVPQIYHWIGAAFVLPGLMLANSRRTKLPKL